MSETEPFGQIAIRMGFCTQEDVDSALAEQQRLSQEGKKHKLIGMLLLERRALSTAQFIQILKYYEHPGRVPSLEEDTGSPE